VRHVNERDVEPIGAVEPHIRTLRHLAAPWTNGSEHVWVAVTEFGPGAASGTSAHEGREEVFYVVSGHGVIEVGDEAVEVEPGSTVVVGPGETHRILSSGTDVLKMISCVSPPFDESEFAAAKPIPKSAL
jgi:mannose-6-phosphate isomerase-like protein (cupin superfamily)